MLSKEQAEALKDVLKTKELKTNVVTGHLDVNNWRSDWSPLNDLSLDTLIRALYIGYEVEKTPEAIIWEEYQYQRDPNEAANDSFADGMKFVIDTLNIKIKGINE